jgi:hypothetical protein
VQSVQEYWAGEKSSSSCQWSVLGGTIISRKSEDTFVVAWGVAGKGKVYLVKTDPSSGCSSADSLEVVVHALPYGGSLVPTQLCARARCAALAVRPRAERHVFLFGNRLQVQSAILSERPTVTPFKNGRYYVLVTDAQTAAPHRIPLKSGLIRHCSWIWVQTQ